MAESKTSYKSAGVDIDKANLFVNAIKPLIKSTNRPEVIGDLGSFGGLFRLDQAKYSNPVLVSSTDGVGTKLRIAQLMNRHDTIGIDLVAMCVNDVVVQGAEPLFFLDYLANGKIDVERNVQIIKGISEGCRIAGCALIGGENAEMPGFYNNDDYDLAGFSVGVVDKDHLIDGSKISDCDAIIGLASSGLHSNGYSLARKIIFDVASLSTESRVEGLDSSIGEELLRPTKIYVKPLLSVLSSFPVNGIVHVTGGGFWENIPRVLPNHLKAVIKRNSWPVPPIFNVLMEMGSIDEYEMFRVFNMGIGMILIVPQDYSNTITALLRDLGELAFPIGTIEHSGSSSESVTLI